MTTILLAITGWEPEAWLGRFRAKAGGREVRLYPDVGDPAQVRYACAWKPPRGALADLPNLSAIFSLGAGVDHLTADPSLPDVPIVRIVDPDLTQRMVEYVALHVLAHLRRMKRYEAQSRERVWREHPDPSARDVQVGILGMGVLGQASARALTGLGFRVLGWSKSPKMLDGIETFAGADTLPQFLGRVDILVCLLPLTEETRGILRYDLFRTLARNELLGGAVLINAGRGDLQVEADILRALDDGTLAGASLDVFTQEPLSPQNPFWGHPKVFVTPHNAAQSNPMALTDYVLQQIERHERGFPLEHVVDRKRGY